MHTSRSGTHSGEKPLEFSPSDANSAVCVSRLIDHPIAIRNYSCPTLSLDALASQVARWVNAGEPRAVIFGPPGSGKTHAIRYISQQLATQMADVAWMKSRSNATVVSGGCLDPVELVLNSHQTVTSAIPEPGSYSFEEYIHVLANHTGQRKIVLWIDESHLLNEAKEDCLRRLQDKLGETGIRLTYLLVGHPDARRLNEKRFAFTGAIQRTVPSLGVEEFELRGILSPDALEFCLEAFDNKCLHGGSDWPYTRFFLPCAYSAGLRLATDARTLWHIYVEEDRDRYGQQATEVPIACLLRSIERVLLDGVVQDSAHFTIASEAWRTAVLRSGWVERQELRRTARELYGIEDLY